MKNLNWGDKKIQTNSHQKIFHSQNFKEKNTNKFSLGTPGQLARWMKHHGITVTHLTPAMGQLLSETVDDTQVTTLRVALFVGDKLTKRDVHRLRKVAPQVHTYALSSRLMLRYSQ